MNLVDSQSSISSLANLYLHKSISSPSLLQYQLQVPQSPVHGILQSVSGYPSKFRGRLLRNGAGEQDGDFLDSAFHFDRNCLCQPIRIQVFVFATKILPKCFSREKRNYSGSFHFALVKVHRLISLRDKFDSILVNLISD